ncbi:MAG: methyltransferase domain-containing protein [Actinomycetota bacterium]|nr:methyltransferase domain-containing protein [Actinomycetota bacterium]
MTAPDVTEPTIQDQAPILLRNAAGYVGHRTINIGLRSGLIETLSEHPDGLTANALADRLGFDAFYTGVWCRSALATGLATRDGDRYRLAPHMDTLLLDPTSPAYVGGLVQVLEMPELFDRFERVLPTGERLWWDECSPEWIAGVAGSGAPFYTRLVPGGVEQVPGLAERLAAGGRIVDTACGTGRGLVRLAEHYPNCELAGIDGDAHSIELAAERVREAGVADGVTLVVSPLEEMTIDPPAALVINNISMHECRDIDAVTRNVLEGLEPGGWFVISDFPFPETDEGLTTVPGRLMAGVQFFEAQIDDQLLSRSAYDELLTRHGFTDLGHVELTPVHALTWGRRPEDG